MDPSQAHVWNALGRCYLCGRVLNRAPGATHREHMVPRSRGGSDEAQNVALACRSCNYAKHAKHARTADEEFERLAWWGHWNVVCDLHGPVVGRSRDEMLLQLLNGALRDETRRHREPGERESLEALVAALEEALVVSQIFGLARLTEAAAKYPWAMPRA